MGLSTSVEIPSGPGVFPAFNFLKVIFISIFENVVSSYGCRTFVNIKFDVHFGPYCAIKYFFQFFLVIEF